MSPLQLVGFKQRVWNVVKADLTALFAGKAAENLEAGYGEKGAQLYYVPADTVVE